LDKLREREGLGPLDPVAPVVGWLKEEAAKGLAGLAIVGHLPFLVKLTSLLVIENESPVVVWFQNGAIVKLVPGPDSARYAIQLVITRQLAEQAEIGAR
jgi:phosphohistidine phosphatase